MKPQVISIATGIALTIFVCGFVYWQTQASSSQQQVSGSFTTPNESMDTSTTQETSNQNSNTRTATSAQKSSTNTQSTQGVRISLAEIAQHNSRSSCWSAINGKVYDLTSWIPQHPGGEEAILSICGIDGSSIFNAQHGGSPRQAAILVGFRIGTLEQ